MIRPLAAIALFALSAGGVAAQDALPAQPEAPEIVIDPAAPINATPKQANLLTGLYATRAVIELCSVTVDEAVLAGMDADQARLQVGLGMDEPTATDAYAQVKADVEKTEPDCAEGSPDRISVDAVTAIYAAQAAAAGPAAAPAATPAQPPAADPAVPAADAAEEPAETPAQ